MGRVGILEFLLERKVKFISGYLYPDELPKISLKVGQVPLPAK